MSTTIFRGTSPNGKARRSVKVTDASDGRICVEVCDGSGLSFVTVYLDPAMADGLGSHLRHRALDVREEQEARDR